MRRGTLALIFGAATLSGILGLALLPTHTLTCSAPDVRATGIITCVENYPAWIPDGAVLVVASLAALTLWSAWTAYAPERSRLAIVVLGLAATAIGFAIWHISDAAVWIGFLGFAGLASAIPLGKDRWRDFGIVVALSVAGAILLAQDLGQGTPWQGHIATATVLGIAAVLLRFVAAYIPRLARRATAPEPGSP